MPTDFRKDYTRLSFFKQNYASVPLLAMTATATQRVQHDVVAQLGINRCLVFKSSFNRPNCRRVHRRRFCSRGRQVCVWAGCMPPARLHPRAVARPPCRYEVRKKKKTCVDEIATMILDKFTTRVNANRRNWAVQVRTVAWTARLLMHRGGLAHRRAPLADWPCVQCGIVYCLSRIDCERVADELERKLADALGHLPQRRRRVKCGGGCVCGGGALAPWRAQVRHAPPAPPASCRHYHANLSAEEREGVQQEWTSGEVPLIVATIAFGMGEKSARRAGVHPPSFMRALHQQRSASPTRLCSAPPLPRSRHQQV